MKDNTAERWAMYALFLSIVTFIIVTLIYFYFVQPYDEECIESRTTGDVLFVWKEINQTKLVTREMVDRNPEFYLGENTYGSERYILNEAQHCNKWALVRTEE